ncbi:MAG: tetratricopeptide repeat protein [Flavobacteriales bacterium]|nr:tetratricopeptide repeat protein [Flavobacteriales bacterium]
MEPRTWTDHPPRWLSSPWFFALLAVVLYANTVRNDFALDDGLVLNENAYVVEGVGGIGDILSHDSFYGSIGTSAYLSGGRYRPLSLVTYAVEVSLFGVDPAVHHAVNVLLYALCCVLVFRFLGRHIFPTSRWAVCCTTLLFTVHPVHTEVIANIKGRDELLSLIFLLLTLHHALLHQRWRERQLEPAAESRSKRRERERSGAANEGRWSHVWAGLSFCLALLAKENGLAFVLILPVSLYFLTHATIVQALKRSLPVIVVVIGYIALRVVLLEARNNTVQEVMDNPYLYAAPLEKVATILFVQLRYIGLMLWPHPLSYDYSFHQIPYRTFGDPMVLLSLALHVYLLVIVVKGWVRKDLLAWCIVFYLGTLFLISNLAFNIGAPMAERFLFQASLPFLIALTALVRRLLAEVPAPRMLHWSLGALLFSATCLSAFAVMARNTQWRTGDDLFLHDVAAVPNSVRARTFAGIALIHRSESTKDTIEQARSLQSSIVHFQVADSLHDRYMPTLLNMGIGYYRMDSLDAAIRCWERARDVDPADEKLRELDGFLHDRFLQEGNTAGLRGDWEKGIGLLNQALHYDSLSVDAWYNLGGIHFTARHYAEARIAWERTLRLRPDHAQARAGTAALNALERPAQ